MSIKKATREAVQAAYDAFLAEGIVPTAEAVLQRTGGSKSTVCRHLHAIRADPPPSTAVPLSPPTSPSLNGPVELPLEWREAADGLSQTVASLLTRTIAAERERAAQLLDAEAAARAAAVAAARAETEAARRALEESQMQAAADFDIAIGEVEALQGIIAALLKAAGLEDSDDLNDLRSAASSAVDLIRGLTETAGRVPVLEVEIERRISEVRTAEARIVDLQEAANRAELRHQELLGTASRVPALESAVQAAKVRIAELSAQLVGSAETAGRVKALEEVVVQLTSQLARAVAPPSAPPVPPRSRPAKRAAATPAARAEKNGAASPPAPAPETSSADQPLANLVLAAPSPADGGSSDAPAPPVTAA